MAATALPGKPPDQLFVQSGLGWGSSRVWASELATTAQWAVKYWDGETWRPIPPAWKDKRNWNGLRFRGSDG